MQTAAVSPIYWLKRQLQVEEYEARVNLKDGKVDIEEMLQILMRNWAQRWVLNHIHELGNRMSGVTDREDPEREVGLTVDRMMAKEDPMEDLSENIGSPSLGWDQVIELLLD